MRVLIILFLLTGCKKPLDTWHSEFTAIVARKSRCNEWQLKMVEKQFEICNKTTYTSSYCYDTAIVVNCSLIIDEVEE